VYAGAWLCGALRWWASCFGLDVRGARSRWLGAVHAHVMGVAEVEREELHEMVKQAMRARELIEAGSRLRAREVGFWSYDLILSLLVKHGIKFGRLTGVGCSRFALRALCMICYGGLPLARTQAHYSRRELVGAAGIQGDLRRACLFCLVTRGVCVLESEWHFIWHCPLFTKARSGPLFRERAAGIVSEFHSFPHPYMALVHSLPFWWEQSMRVQELGSFIRLSLRVRDKWLDGAAVGGLRIDLAAREAAQVYSSSEAFALGVALSV